MMEDKDSRKIILEKIRAARTGQEARLKTSFPKPVTDPSLYQDDFEDPPELAFARNLTLVKGKFAYCPNNKELTLALRILFHEQTWGKIFCAEPAIRDILKKAGIPSFDDLSKIDEAQAAVTGCEYLVARTGSVMVSSAQGSGRRIFAHAPVHIIIGHTSQMVNELREALSAIKGKYGEMPSQVSLITGPSRTADIEKTLVMGAHGPRELYVFLLNDQ